jgi:replicative DNA helicase
MEPIETSVRRSYDRLEYSLAHQEVMGVPTGFIDLDNLLAGLQDSDFIVVAARPSVGKTSFVLSIADNVVSLGKRVAIFSLQMSSEQVVQRILSAHTGIECQRMRSGSLPLDERALLVQATAKLADLPIFIDDTPSISPLQIRAKAVALFDAPGLDLVIVDYLQLMTSDVHFRSRTQELSYISRSLKSLARELDMPVMVTSQLPHAVEQRDDKRPLLADLAELGSLDQYADVVMFIYRDELYHPETEKQHVADILVSKHQNGPTGEVQLFFRDRLAQFLDFSSHNHGEVGQPGR